MTVPNSLPVKFSDVIAEFGGGANAPKNLGAYRAGAGYTPAGAKGGSAAIPVAGGDIPSGFPLNLGAFPGSKKELSVSQFWPYKGNYLRNVHHWNSAPAATYANNTDPTRGFSNFNGSNSAYMNNGVIWQQKKFFNANDSSIPDSGQCTVVYLVNNGSFSNTMSQGTGLSVRGLDATGVVQHMTPIATGKYNFVTIDNRSELAMSYASYNCSMKKITDIFTAMTDGAYAGTWDMLIILPGLKKVKEAPVTVDGTGYDIKPANPINPDEVVLGMRYDGAGNYQIQYENQTFPNFHRADWWWYNNGAFDLEANTGSTPVFLTTTVPQQDGPASVWIVMNEQTGSVYSPGLNPIWGTLLVGSSIRNGEVTFLRNGGVTARINSAAYDLPTYATCPENWWIGTTLTSMPGDNYWITLIPQSGSNAPTGPTGFAALSSSPTYSSPGGTQCVCSVYIANNPAGSNPYLLGTVILSSQASSGGGGGGSVSVNAYMPGHDENIRARDLHPGDGLWLLNPERNGTVAGEVVTNRVSEQNLLTLVSESGIELTCSDNTPLTLEDGSCINSTEALNKRLPVEDENGFRWEEIVEVRDAGRGLVATIYCLDQCYAAGDVKGRYIWTHNAVSTK